jgi:hypothetical protein
VTEYRRQSIQATTPSRIGFPRRDRRCAVLPNLLASLDASWRHTASCRDDNMLTQNESQWRRFFQLFESRAGKKATRGGRSDTEVKDPTIIASGSPCASTEVMTHTPVGYCARTWRYHLGSIIWATESGIYSLSLLNRWCHEVTSAPSKPVCVSRRQRTLLLVCRPFPRIARFLRSGSLTPRPMDTLSDRARPLWPLGSRAARRH